MRVESRKALLVGIDTYAEGIRNLNCCENDAKRLMDLLQTHEKGDPNFSCKKLTSNEAVVKKSVLKNAIEALFRHEPEFVLLYFSGHGYSENGKGFLICQDTDPTEPEKSLEMEWLITKANESKIPEIAIILDCCHAGNLGDLPILNQAQVNLRKGITILAATTSSEVAVERMGNGIFTNILCQGLEGAAADILGHVTTAGLYNLADSTLSPWEQRPVFKSYVSQMKPLRYCFPRIPKRALRRICNHFQNEESSIELSEEFLEYSRKANPSKVGLFKELEGYEIIGLVKGERAKTLTIEAEIKGKCILTPYGKIFWQTVKKGLV